MRGHDAGSRPVRHEGRQHGQHQASRQARRHQGDVVRAGLEGAREHRRPARAGRRRAGGEHQHLRARRGPQRALRPPSQAGRGEGGEAHLQPGGRALGHRAVQAAGIASPRWRRGKPEPATLRLSGNPDLRAILWVRPRAAARQGPGRGNAMDQVSKTPLLDRVKTPEDLRALPEKDLRQLADELRQETIDAVSVTGGHLGAGLGVVELTVALHHVFDTPRDRLVWDVGHQAYPHKILTGRRDRIRTLRQGGGLSGFTKRAESEYDPFGAAHSSTSISAGLGMAVARDLAGKTNNVVCVIGDGAMSAGMAYEAMNNAGARNERLIVILNDNDMSIAPPVGALSAYLARISSSGTYLHLREIAKQLAKRLPKYW